MFCLIITMNNHLAFLYCFQVHLFILQIQISDQGISAANHFEVNKATIISVSITKDYLSSMYCLWYQTIELNLFYYIIVQYINNDC